MVGGYQHFGAMLPPFSGQTISSTTIIEALCSTDTAVSTNRTTKHLSVNTCCDKKSKSYVHKYPHAGGD